jgi:hypothetical protein
MTMRPRSRRSSRRCRPRFSRLCGRQRNLEPQMHADARRWGLSLFGAPAPIDRILFARLGGQTVHHGAICVHLRASAVESLRCRPCFSRSCGRRRNLEPQMHANARRWGLSLFGAPAPINKTLLARLGGQTVHHGAICVHLRASAVESLRCSPRCSRSWGRRRNLEPQMHADARRWGLSLFGAPAPIDRILFARLGGQTVHHGAICVHLRASAVESL